MTTAISGAYMANPDQLTYRFGPLDNPTLVINGIDDDGCMWIVGEPDGWSAPEAVTPIDERAFGDGGYAGDTTFAARTLSFGSPEPGLCVAPTRDLAARKMALLRSVCQGREAVLYTQTEYPYDQSLLLRASGRPRFRWVAGVPGGPSAFEWQFVMVAEDPFKFDAAQLAVPVSTGLPQTPGGYTYNLVYNLVYGLGSASAGQVVIVNAGDEPSQAIFAMTGPLDRPTVFVPSTGQSFLINRSWGALDTVTVDTRNGTVLLNGTSIFADFVGEFPLLPPGSNTVQWSHQGVFNAAARLTVTSTSTSK